MLKSIRFQALAFVTVGVVLGYLAAIGGLQMSERAQAEGNVQERNAAGGPVLAADSKTASAYCLSHGNQELLLAQADVEIAQASTQKKSAPGPGQEAKHRRHHGRRHRHVEHRRLPPRTDGGPDTEPR